jgi:hypothetical protein
MGMRATKRAVCEVRDRTGILEWWNTGRMEERNLRNNNFELFFGIG